jgi:hypothetical protein
MQNLAYKVDYEEEIMPPHSPSRVIELPKQYSEFRNFVPTKNIDSYTLQQYLKYLEYIQEYEDADVDEDYMSNIRIELGKRDF